MREMWFWSPNKHLSAGCPTDGQNLLQLIWSIWGSDSKPVETIGNNVLN